MPSTPCCACAVCVCVLLCVCVCCACVRVCVAVLLCVCVCVCCVCVLLCCPFYLTSQHTDGIDTQTEVMIPRVHSVAKTRPQRRGTDTRSRLRGLEDDLSEFQGRDSVMA